MPPFFDIETPATATEKIFIESEAVHRTSTTEDIIIRWNKDNVTTNYDARLKLTLWGYKETTIRPELLYIDVLEVIMIKKINFCGVYRINSLGECFV